MQTLAKAVAAALLTALLACVPAARAQDAGASLPSAESLFEAHIAAIGGWDAVNKHKDRTLNGIYKVLQTGETRILTIYQEAPNHMRAELEAPAIGTTIRATDGEQTWGTNNTGSPFEVTGRERLELLDGCNFNGEAAYKTAYSTIETTGPAQVGDSAAYRVAFATPSGLTGAVYFDRETKRVLARQLDPASKNDPAFLIVVSDYKEFDGLMLPTKQTQFVGAERVPAVEIEFRWVAIDSGDMPEFTAPENLLVQGEDGS